LLENKDITSKFRFNTVHNLTNLLLCLPCVWNISAVIEGIVRYVCNLGYNYIGGTGAAVLYGRNEISSAAMRDLL
jgi:hypothetical protein